MRRGGWLLISFVALLIGAGVLRYALTGDASGPDQARIAALQACLPDVVMEDGETVDLIAGSDLGTATLRFRSASPAVFRFEQGSFAATSDAGGALVLESLADRTFIVTGGQLSVAATDEAAPRLGVVRAGGSFVMAGSATLSLSPESASSFEVAPTRPFRIPQAAAGADEAVLPRLVDGETTLEAGRPYSIALAGPLAAKPRLIEQSSLASGDIIPGDGGAHVVALTPLWAQAATAVVACASIGAGPARPVDAGLVQTPDGEKVIEVALPPQYPRTFRGLDQDIAIAIATPDGKSSGVWQMIAVAPGMAALASLALTILAFFALAFPRAEQLEPPKGGERHPRARLFYGLFIGVDGPSLALFQIFVWTIVVVWALIYVWLTTGTIVVMTFEVMGLLGIAGVGSVAARLIGANRVGAPATGSTAATQPPEARAFRFWTLLMSDGRFDLMKVQLFLFTIVISIYAMSRILARGVFPEIDANTLLLMGVSQGLYIGGKLAATTAPTAAGELKARIAATESDIAAAQKDLGDRQARDPADPRIPELADQIARLTRVLDGLAAQLEAVE